MRLPIRCNGNYIVDFDQFFVHGREAAGGYGFVFSMRGTRQACENKTAIFSLSLSISLADTRKSLAQSIPSSSQLIKCHNFANSEQVFFEVVFTKEQISAIEDYRQEQDLKLQFGLRSLIAKGEEWFSDQDLADVTLTREQWLDALKKAGYRNTMLFEVPVPTLPDGLALVISKAQEFIEIGHYRDAVMQCRHLIEQVETIREDKKSSGAANNMAHGQNRRDMTAIQRLLSLREQLKNICQLGAHGSEEFTRSQAKSVLGMTMTLLAEPTVGFVPDAVSGGEPN